MVPNSMIILWLSRTVTGDVDEAAANTARTGRVVSRWVTVVGAKVLSPRIVEDQGVFRTLLWMCVDQEDAVSGHELVACEISPRYSVVAGFKHSPSTGREQWS